MEEITLRVPVNVKSILTNQLREQLKTEIQESLNNISLELQQLEFQAKRMISEQNKTNPDNLPRLYDYLDGERFKRLEFQKEAKERLERLEKLELGSEIAQGTLDRTITLRIGDDLHKQMGAEILLEDGKIVAFRT